MRAGEHVTGEMTLEMGLIHQEEYNVVLGHGQELTLGEKDHMN